MAIFTNATLYVESFASLKEKVDALDRVIDLLITSAEDNTGSAHLDEYQLDDGQTKIKAVYRTTADLATAIFDFESLKQIYLNRMNGRVMKGRDARNRYLG